MGLTDHEYRRLDFSTTKPEPERGRRWLGGHGYSAPVAGRSQIRLELGPNSI